MVGSSGGKIFVNSGKLPYVFYGKVVQTNSVKCTGSKKIHKWCSGVRDDFLLVVYGFRCKRYDGATQEVDLAKDLVVNGEQDPYSSTFPPYGAVVYPLPMTLASGGSPIFPLVVHQPASPSIWPAVQSLRRGLSTNPGLTMWCVCGCS